MPGDDWQKFANVRLLFGYQFAQPGKKMLFMGDEFGQWKEWNHDSSLDWHLLDEPDARRPQALGPRPEHPLSRLTPNCTSWTPAPKASPGSTPTTPSRAS